MSIWNITGLINPQGQSISMVVPMTQTSSGSKIYEKIFEANWTGSIGFASNFSGTIRLYYPDSNLNLPTGLLQVATDPVNYISLSQLLTNSQPFKITVNENNLTYRIDIIYDLGIVGAFTNWGANADLIMTETSPGSKIFTRQLPYSGEFKFRINSNWNENYGSSGWPSGSLILGGDNIVAPTLQSSQFYNVTVDLNNLTYSAVLGGQETPILETPILVLPSTINKTFGDSQFEITHSSNSTGSLSYHSDNPSVATMSGSTVSIVGGGNATIEVTQEATQNHSSVTRTIALVVNKATPTLNVPSTINKTFGDSQFEITPSSSNSTGLLSCVSDTPSVATASGTTVSIVGAGQATITVTQEATQNHSSVTRTIALVVNKATPRLSNFTIPNLNYDDLLVPIDIIAPRSDSTGVFSYTSSNTLVAYIEENTTTILPVRRVGTSTITATQAATSNHNSATISTTFKVTTLSNFNLLNKTHGQRPFTINPPTTNSTGEITYTSSNPLVATTSGNILTIVKDGISTITATQESTSSYPSDSISSQLIVNASSPENPVVVSSVEDFEYFLTTSSTHLNLSSDLNLTANLSNFGKVLQTTQNVSISALSYSQDTLYNQGNPPGAQNPRPPNTRPSTAV